MRIRLKSICRWLADLVFQPPADLLVNKFIDIDERLHR